MFKKYKGLLSCVIAFMMLFVVPPFTTIQGNAFTQNQDFGTGTSMPAGWVPSGNFISVRNVSAAPAGAPASVAGSALNASATGTGQRTAFVTITSQVPTPPVVNFSFDFFMAGGGANTVNMFTLGHNQADCFMDLSGTFFALGNGDAIGARHTLSYFNYATGQWIPIANASDVWLRVNITADFGARMVSFTLSNASGAQIGSFGPFSFASSGATSFNRIVMSGFRTTGGSVTLNTWVDNFVTTSETTVNHVQNFGAGTEIPAGWAMHNGTGSTMAIRSVSAAPTGAPARVTGSALNASGSGNGNRNAFARISNYALGNGTRVLMPNQAEISFDFFMPAASGTHTQYFSLGFNQGNSYADLRSTFFALGNGVGVGAANTLRYHNYETGQWVTVPNASGQWLRITLDVNFANRRVSFTIDNASGTRLATVNNMSFASSGADRFNQIQASVFRGASGSVVLNTWVDNFAVRGYGINPAHVPQPPLPTVTEPRQMEYLGRGVVAVRNGNNIFVSWRLLATDPNNIAFNLYRSANGGAFIRLNAAPLTQGTNFTDTTANLSVRNEYRVRPVINGVAQEASTPFTVPANPHNGPLFTIPIRDGAHIQRAWVGDFTGDGEFDFLIDRHPATGAQSLEAYTRYGEFLWEVNLGPGSHNRNNISPGPTAVMVGHWDGVTVFDMDGSGTANVMIRLADGVIFGDGQIFRAPAGQQFIGILDGRTGALISYVLIPTDFANYGPMGAHFGIGYLNGVTPSLVSSMKNRRPDGGFNMMICAFEMVNGQLQMQWQWNREGFEQAEDSHQFWVADIDGSGRDSIIHIGFVLNPDGTFRYSMGCEEIIHGDRFYVGRFEQDGPITVFGVQQDNRFGVNEAYWNAATGVRIWANYSDTRPAADIGRGVIGQLFPNRPGFEMWSFFGIHNASGERLTLPHQRPYPAFTLWWDGNLLSTMFQDGRIENFNHQTLGMQRLVTTWHHFGARFGARSSPLFIGDIFGDWREEIVLTNNYNNVLIVFTTDIPTNHRIYALAQNPLYRNSMTTTGYLQSNALDFYIGPTMNPPPRPNIVMNPRYAGAPGMGINENFGTGTTMPAGWAVTNNNGFGISVSNNPPAGATGSALRLEGSATPRVDRSAIVTFPSQINNVSVIEFDINPFAAGPNQYVQLTFGNNQVPATTTNTGLANTFLALSIGERPTRGNFGFWNYNTNQWVTIPGAVGQWLRVRATINHNNNTVNLTITGPGITPVNVTYSKPASLTSVNSMVASRTFTSDSSGWRSEMYIDNLVIR